MSWWSDITRALKDISPREGVGVVTTSYVPNLAGAKLLEGGALDTYGDLAELLTDGGNTSDCWVEALILSEPTQAANDYYICLSREAAASPPTKIEAEVPVLVKTTIVADTHYVVPIKPPCYFPKGTGIRAAVAEGSGAKDIKCWAIISRGR